MIVGFAVVAFLVVAALAWGIVRKRRSEALKHRFGAEYERAVAMSGSRARAEADLLSRTKRVERLDIHPLSAADHDRFAERWRSTQASFVDEPARAVSDADTLVMDVMRARGYPVSDFDQRAADLSVDHPGFVQNYREARALALSSQRGEARTEELRQAIVHYRALFEHLLEARPAEMAR